MPTYAAPGVYVEIVKVAPPIQPVGTSTAGFIGNVPDGVTMPATAVGVPLQLNAAVLAQLAKDGIPAGVIGKITPVAAAFTADDAFFTAIQGVLTAQEYAAYRLKIIARARPQFPLQAAGTPVLFTSFDQFTRNFGEVQAENSVLAHAVFGFFQNGGTRCYVARTNAAAGTLPTGNDLKAILGKFEAIDEISIVCVPGLTALQDSNEVIGHCLKMKYRFAVLDGKNVTVNTRAGITDVPLSPDNNYAGLYYPWIKIANLDPRTVGTAPTIDQPPSGHVCGLMARVDQQSGTHFAPANEIVRGASGLKIELSKSDQEGLNLLGVNLIRNFRGAIKVWGARTLADPAGDTGAFKYVNVQRTMSFIAQSIDEGSQFVVFKPNSPRLWAQVKRVVTAFLTNVWRDGALFGNTPEEAFFVKVDASNNPDDVIALGRLIIEVGVAIVQPAEFVIFRIQQFTQIPKS